MNIERDKLAEQKKQDDAANALKEAEYQKTVIQGDKYKEFMADCGFAKDAVGQLCYYLDDHPNQAPGFEYTKLSETLSTLEKLDKIIKEKYPNANTNPSINRNRDNYAVQPGVFREVADQRVVLAQRALKTVVQEQMTAALPTFSEEFANLKDAGLRNASATMFCLTYVQWAYMPEPYESYKNSIKQKFEPAYKAAGLTMNTNELFAEMDKQVAQVKEYVEANIAAFTLARKKGFCSLEDKEAEAVVLKSFKAYYPNATVLHFGCSGDYITNKDESYVPPKITGKGKNGFVLAKVPGMTHLVSFSVGIEKKYSNGQFGAVQLFGNGNPFSFDGLMSAK